MTKSKRRTKWVVIFTSPTKSTNSKVVGPFNSRDAANRWLEHPEQQDQRWQYISTVSPMVAP